MSTKPQKARKKSFSNLMRDCILGLLTLITKYDKNHLVTLLTLTVHCTAINKIFCNSELIHLLFSNVLSEERNQIAHKQIDAKKDYQ